MSTGSKKLREMAARCLMLGFEGFEPPPDALRLLAAGAGGVILFSRNVYSAGQVRSLTRRIRSEAAAPVLVSVDQEGGRVARLRGIATDLPAMREVGLHGEEAAGNVGRLLGLELSALGFDIALSPVADVDTNPNNPVIGDRSFSSDPGEAARLTVAFVSALQQAGIGGCAKHFPGHGDTSVDSHVGLPIVRHDLDRLERVELLPFSELARAGVAMMMTAHIRVDSVDDRVPATLSRPVLDVLRGRLGYRGVVLTDDLEMAAISGRYDTGDAAVQALNAGCDMVLVCHRSDRQERVIEAVTEAVESGRLPRSRLEQCVRRIGDLSRRFAPGRSRPDWRVVLRSREHLDLAAALTLSSPVPTGGSDPTALP